MCFFKNNFKFIDILIYLCNCGCINNSKTYHINKFILITNLFVENITYYRNIFDIVSSRPVFIPIMYMYFLISERYFINMFIKLFKVISFLI